LNWLISFFASAGNAKNCRANVSTSSNCARDTP
jgi:hypothetical protein